MKKFRSYCCVIIICAFVLLLNSVVSAQNGVAINSTGAVADSSSILDVSSHSKGLLVPRMTSAEINAIQSPAEGLMVINTTTKCLEIYFSGIWQSIFCGCNPAAPGQITGPVSLCENQVGVTYTVALVNGATTYTWTVPAGSTITSGQGSNTIVVTTGTTSGVISVVAGNGCGSSAPSNLNVSVSPVPASPGTITGPTTVTIGQTNVSYSVVNVPGITYAWTVPAGSTIVSGQGTNGILVTFGSTSGNICVTASNSCGTSVASCSAITVNNCPPGSQTFTYTGTIQSFSVPSCISTVTIETWGAQGGSNLTYTGGLGAYIKGTFTVTPGSTLKVIAGGQGQYLTSAYNTGGGGGSYVWVDGQTTPLICAGGGGGAGGSVSGVAASTSNNGTAGTGGGIPGTAGNGATPGGAGWYTNGGDHTGSTSCAAGCYLAGIAQGGFRPLAGGAGGCAGTSQTGNGGFGGGSGGNGNCITSYGAGGGGGYSGGAGQTGSGAGGGGGGSFNSGTNQTNTANVQSGNGQVIITW